MKRTNLKNKTSNSMLAAHNIVIVIWSKIALHSSSDVWKLAELEKKNLTWQRLVKRYNCFTTLNVLDISHRSFYQRFPDNILRMTLQSRTSIFDWNLQADLINDETWLWITCCWLTAVYEMFYINQSQYTTPWSEII